MEYDVAIIGLGPAGATAARLLSPKLRVIAIDKKAAWDETAFTKPCGGLLAPDAQKALSKFNLTLPKDVLVDPQIFAVRTVDLENDLLRCYQRFYMNLDRRKFDEWLISLIPPNVEIAAGCRCADIRRIDGGFEVAYSDGAAARTVTAKRVIGADGSDSSVRRALFPDREIRRLTAIQQWFTEEHATPFYSCVFDSEITPSYCWSISKDGFFILGGAFPIEDSRARFERLKSKLAQRGFIFGEPAKTEACLVSIPRGWRDFCAGTDGAFLIGEAAGFISPSSLEGISYALDSAHAVVRAINGGGDANRAYARLSAPIRRKLMMKHVKSQFMYRPFLRKLVMKSGLDSVEVEEQVTSDAF
ncbi:MAG: FAD-binding protein [Oscillospiraceae bacterium]|jgi:flavin-dependent dehydrogenase|nr:FAD-binding protein [Oscillospiraceae bacterium]